VRNFFSFPTFSLTFIGGAGQGRGIWDYWCGITDRSVWFSDSDTLALDMKHVFCFSGRKECAADWELKLSLCGSTVVILLDRSGPNCQFPSLHRITFPSHYPLHCYFPPYISICPSTHSYALHSNPYSVQVSAQYYFAPFFPFCQEQPCQVTCNSDLRQISSDICRPDFDASFVSSIFLE